MARNATAVLQPATAEPEKKPTYKINGVTKTLDEMLEVKTGCGQQRYGLLHESKCQPKGTLFDKLDPLATILTEEAEAEAAAKKRLAEGHKPAKISRFVAHSSAAAALGR